MTNLWIVGRVVEFGDDGVGDNWAFMGVFDTEESAVVACTTENDFVGPAVLNERLSEEDEEWPDHYFPLDNADGRELLQD